ncbi:MAG: MFS transporter [Vicinamibacteria bacterium]
MPPEDRPAWGLLAALTALNVLSYVDRQLIVTLAPLLMRDLGLSRGQIGLLVGASFIVAFAGLSLAMGAAADRVSRPRLIAAGLGVWSAATALTSVARRFADLVLLRAAVGVGEATLSPAALSMLSDRFPLSRLGFASSVFYAGIPVGFGLSFLLAGWIGPWLGWRACFVFLGVAGFVAIVAVAALRDTRRRGAAAGPSAGMVRGLSAALVERPSILLLSLAGAFFAFTSSASQHTITWLVEDRGFPYGRAAFLSAAVVAGGGLLGNVLFGAASDRARRRHPAGRIVLSAIFAACGLAFAAAFYSIPASSPLFVPLWFGVGLWMLGWFGPVLAALSEAAPPGQRGGVIGFGLLTVNLLGVAPGPWVTGMIGDRAGLTTGLLVSLAVGALGLVPLLGAAWLEARAAARLADR